MAKKGGRGEEGKKESAETMVRNGGNRLGASKGTRKNREKPPGVVKKKG